MTEVKVGEKAFHKIVNNFDTRPFLNDKNLSRNFRFELEMLIKFSSEYLQNETDSLSKIRSPSLSKKILRFR